MYYSLVMYSNARFANPIIARKKAPKSATDDFQVGTISPSYDTFVHANRQTPQEDKEIVRHLPKILYRLPQARTLPTQSRHCPLLLLPKRHSRHLQRNLRRPFQPQVSRPPAFRQAGTTVKLPKNRPIAEHVGASHHQNPINVIGEKNFKTTSAFHY